MPADKSDPETITPQPARTAFRSRPTPAGTPLAPSALTFAPSSAAAGSDRDILMGYQIFLGRDPENSFVINEAKSTPLRGFVTGLMLSGEFNNSVLQNLARRAPMPHDRNAVGPAPEQVEWLATLLSLPQSLAQTAAAMDWRSFWSAMIALPGFPRGAEAGAAIREAPEATAADAGFILIQIDQPKPGEKLHPGALLNGAGWAIAPEDITQITVTLDDLVLAHARYGLPRPDVARNFPHYRHVDHCGFAFSAQVPADAIVTASSQLAILVRTVSGQTGRRGVRVQPPAPPAQAVWPIRLFVEDARVDNNATLRLRGWGLSRARTAAIAVFLGDTKLGDAEHGLSRPDIAEIYTDYPSAGRSGFTFGASLAGQLPGPAAVRVQITDAEGQQRQVIMPVMVPEAPGAPGSTGAPAAAAKRRRAAPAPEDSAIRFQCDGARLEPGGAVSITGWALAPGGVRDITAMRGRTKLTVAVLGGSRPDVVRSFPMVREAAQSGFRIQFTPTKPLQPGDVITLRLRAIDGESLSLDAPLEAARTSETAAARGPSASSAARLEIDQPVLAGDAALTPVRGALTISGWAVAPRGIAEVNVLCDGKKLGQAYLGMRREDIARAFPDCEDSLRAGYALVLPPGAVPDGERQFTVLAASRDGEVQSRSFGVTIEPASDLQPGSTPRRSMPRAEQAFMMALLDSRQCHPVFSIVILPAAGKKTDALLQTTLASLTRQTYKTFKVVPSPSRDPGGTPAAGGPKPSLKKPTAGPTFAMTLRAGDELGCDALLEFAVAAAMDPQDGFIYADDLRFDPVHDRRTPFHKPDWSPELQRNMDYIGRPWCASQATMDRAGLTLADLAELSSYAAILRLTAAATRIRHINKVLAATEGATDAAEAARALRGRTGALPPTLENGDPAKDKSLEPFIKRGAKNGRLGPQAPSRESVLRTTGPGQSPGLPSGKIEPGPVSGTWRLRRAPRFRGLVSIIMPTAGHRGLVRRAIDSIRATTQPGQVEIVVLDNVPAADRATKTWLTKHADQVLPMPGTFNWSRFNNHAARHAKGDIFLFLNDDIEAEQPGWLEALLEHATRPEVGVTGARLLYPDGKVQHGGQYLADTHARHAFRFADGNDAGPFGLAAVTREMAAVTGACQMVRRDIFDQLGGFDEAHDVVNNDLDFCLRAQAAGLSVIYTPHASLMHHELASRAEIEDSYDSERFSGDWRATLLRGDPFHSRRLHADADHYAPDPEPVLPIHAGPAGPDLAAIRRILAVKLDHIGDFLTAVPALRALKTRFPGAHLTVLVPPASAALARKIDGIDDIQEFTFFHARSAEGQRGVTDQEYAALETRMAALDFDLAMDLRMQPETRQVLRHTAAKLLAGYDRNGAYPWLDIALEWEGDQRLLPKHAHISERLISLVDATAAACRPIAGFSVPPIRDAATVPALARLPRDFLAKRLVCVHPGVGNPVRQWPATAFAALIDLLGAEEDMHAVLVGGGDEQDVAKQVMDAVIGRDRVVSLVGSLKLTELSDVMQACALFVGNNSGPKHIAASLGVPVLGIHSSVVDAAEWAPLGGAAMALQRRVICGPCYLEFASDCPRGLACLTGIKPRDALAACRRLLAMHPAAADAASARYKIRRQR